MKKIIISIIVILLVIFCSIIFINFLGTNNKNSNIKKAKTVLMINNHVDEVKSMNIYYGDKTYYIADYFIDNKEFIGVLNTKYDLINSIEKDKLYNIDKDYVIGYKNDKIIYEVKENKKDGIIYYYYDAVNGDVINKINMDR